MPDKTEGTDARDQPKAVDLYLHTMAKNSEDIKYREEGRRFIYVGFQGNERFAYCKKRG